VSPEEQDIGAADYVDRVRAWAGSLRAGSTQTWRDFLADPESGPAPTAARSGGPLPGSAQLEVVRRLSLAGTADLPDFAALADLVLSSTGPGRGLVDVPLPWSPSAPGASIGTPSVEPEDLPADELIRACVGVLVRLLSSVPPIELRPSARPWRPWRRGFTLLGAPNTVGLVRDALLGRGLREGGGSRTTYVVLGGPLEELMVQRWSARVRAGAAMRWQRMWRTAAAHDRVPPGIALPTIAEHLADEFGPARVHVVLAADPAETLTVVADVLGVAAGPVPRRSEVLATDLLRRLNPALTLAMGEQARRRVIDQVWADVAGGEEPQSLGVPAMQFDWAVETGERMAAALAAARADGRYAVHGDPALVVPARRPGVRRAPDPDGVLAHALAVVGRTWRLVGNQAAGGQG
jgi:hypothetical protein